MALSNSPANGALQSESFRSQSVVSCSIGESALQIGLFRYMVLRAICFFLSSRDLFSIGESKTMLSRQSHLPDFFISQYSTAVTKGRDIQDHSSLEEHVLSNVRVNLERLRHQDFQLRLPHWMAVSSTLQQSVALELNPTFSCTIQNLTKRLQTSSTP